MLTDAKIKAARPRATAYKLVDAQQLFLHVTPAGGRHWRMNYTYGKNDKGKPAQKTLSFGAYPAVTLLEARKRRDDAKDLLRQGRDPAVEKRVKAKAQAIEGKNTFEIVARRWHELRKAGWTAVHSKDVITSLEADIFDAIGDLPITTIKAPKLLELLQKIEDRGAIETAHRVRQRISAVFVYGIAAGLCEADPAASLGKALREVPRSKKQPSIVAGQAPFEENVTAVRQLLIDCEAERCRAVTKLALRMIAITAVRPGELHGARWAEIEEVDWSKPNTASPKALWRIPAVRMKGDQSRKAEDGGDHLVPLPRQAVEILHTLRSLTGHVALIFPSERHLHRPMSENTLRALLIRAGYYQRHVPHGFRAAFSTIMNELMKQQGKGDDRAVVDLMLAHVPDNKVEGAYNRASYMPRRRELAQEWADLLLDGFWPADIHLGQPIRYQSNAERRAA